MQQSRGVTSVALVALVASLFAVCLVVDGRYQNSRQIAIEAKATRAVEEKRIEADKELAKAIHDLSSTIKPWTQPSNKPLTNSKP